MMEGDTKTVVLGTEWDDALRARLLEVLRALGAQLQDRRSALAGSQGIDTFDIVIDGRHLMVEAETYIGLSLTGPPDLVEKIRSLLSS
jgi:hypothetical protein